MSDRGILVLGGQDIAALLAGREAELIDIVGRAYLAHRDGKSSLPHSSFLRFPDNDRDRIIALPAFLADGFDLAGLKWVSSFPGNLQKGFPRASAVLILNDAHNGRPVAILEGSLISARRTAASAALGARVLLGGQMPATVGLIGTGLINQEIAQFLGVAIGAKRFLLHDLHESRARAFAAKLGSMPGKIEAEVAESTEEVLAACPLVSFATTAAHPHIHDLSACTAGAVILHISLRDIGPEAILACDNIVDDVDHVCRERTSVHLAEQASGGRDFIRCTLADILKGNEAARRGDGSITVFSPFGLGILDIAVGELVLRTARVAGRGTEIASFLETSSD
ncbi:MAG TPA: 2,3-diaminopropionate biosynthesis protein SbnB [Thermoanaerobaculia bacterium]